MKDLKQCCEKCACIHFVKGITSWNPKIMQRPCDNPACPCHQPWEQQLDLEIEDCKVVHVYDTDFYKKIKTFIKALLASQRQDYEILVNTTLDTKNREIAKAKQETLSKVSEMAEGLKDDVSDCVHTPVEDCSKCGYNQALEDIKSKLKEI